MALLESLVRGIPVIATDCPTGPRDIVIPGKNGWLSPPGDVEALATTLTQALTHGPLAWDAQTIRDDVVARFGPNQVFARARRVMQKAGP